MIKVVGLLQRGRKYEIVQFEGETLFQGRDDLTQILLTRFEIYITTFLYISIFNYRTVEQVKEVFRPVDDLSLCWGMIGNMQEQEKIVPEH